MSYNDEENLQLLRETTGGLPYKPATYTCITEFTDNFPQKKATEFEQQYFPATESAWQPEAPFPKIYTKNYRKSILLTLK
jgi:hypothetical protein